MGYPYDEIKKLCIKSMFYDDELMNIFVLKGGNAISLIYKLDSRASFDLDFSMGSDFDKEEILKIETRLQKAVENVFEEEKFKVIDFKFEKRPKRVKDGHPYFWGGYRIAFKIVGKSVYEEYKENENSLRKRAESLDSKHTKKIKIDLSKFEYCSSKRKEDLDGYTIYVYSPEMILFEKLRAICQQMPAYTEKVKTSKTARARDFYDIVLIDQNFEIDYSSEENKNLMKSIFGIKEVPLDYLLRIKGQKDFHEMAYDSLKDTVTKEIKDFDFYFVRTLKIIDKISKSLGIK